MERKMFCYQCQETAGCTGCTLSGVCGKKPDVAAMQDLLIYVTKGLSAVTTALREQGAEISADVSHLITLNLFTTITNVNFNNETILQIKNDIEKEKAAVSTTHFADYDMAELWRAGEDVRSLKSLILFGLKGMAAYAYHARALGKTDPAVNRYFYEALAALGEEKSADDLLKLVLKTGEVNLACMALLDAANTEAYGDPVPVTVPLTIEKGPFIVVSGHDLHDLKLLLEHPGQVFSPREIYRKVWKDAPFGSENTVAVHIRHLREKIEIDPAEPRYLKVVWGQGYKLEKGMRT